MKRRKFISNVGGLGLFTLFNNKVMGQIIPLSSNFFIEQFEDKGLAHFSYAVMAGKKIIIIDPQRNPQVYYDFAEKNNASIVGVIETHPHADFVSSHLEIHEKLNVPIYASSLTKSKYPLKTFDEGNIIQLTDQVGLRAMYTPGHAPDHIAAVLFENEKDKVVFCRNLLIVYLKYRRGNPILIYCGSGYRSAAAASILKKDIPSIQVYDLGPQVSQYISSAGDN